MSYPSDNFSYSSATYRLIIPSLNVLCPEPSPGDPGEWVHVPHGGNKFETDGSVLHTIWTPDGGIVIPNPDHYPIFRSLLRRFAPLQTKWGTFNARLAKLDVRYHSDDGSFRGSVTWEWA